MFRVAPEFIRERYDETARDSLASALEILEKQGFFKFLVTQNNRLLVEAYDDESEAELAKKILENRQINRILLSIPTLIQTLKEIQDA